MEKHIEIQNFKMPPMQEAYLEDIKSQIPHDPFLESENQEHAIINLERILKPIPGTPQRHIDILRRFHGIDCKKESVEEIRKTAGLNGESVSKQKIYQIVESTIYHLKKHYGNDKAKSYMAHPN